jgi:hypothetical protein
MAYNHKVDLMTFNLAGPYARQTLPSISLAAPPRGAGAAGRIGTILTMRRRPLVNQEVRLRATFLG